MNSKRKALKPIEILEDRAMSLSIRHVYASSCMKFTGRILIGLLLVTSSLQAAERWPPIAIEQYRSQANEAAGLYQELREKARFRRPTELSKTYHESGQYLGYGELKHFRTGGRTQLDADGLALIRYGDTFHYNPVTLSQQALAEYSRTGGPTPMFGTAVDKLMTIQDHRGAFIYDFRFQNYNFVFEPGWHSGMAQGQALSALARAYHVLRKDKYLVAGERALDFLNTPREQDGPMTTMADLDPSLNGYIFFMEYPSDPAAYTLNGYMFTLLGLYDWWKLTKSERAGEFFERGIETLVKILPYYDFSFISNYDLAYITIKTNSYTPKLRLSPSYHMVHIEQLWALHNVTGRDILRKTADRWIKYGEAPVE